MYINFDDLLFKFNYLGINVLLGYFMVVMIVCYYDGILEYNVYNLYGLVEFIVMKIVFIIVWKKRLFLLLCFIFVGFGVYIVYWMGDNKVMYNDIVYFIVMVMNFGIVGIFMVGVDICGFYDMVLDEMCSWWI